MALAGESYIEAFDGTERAKLEEMFLVPEDGHRLLSTFPNEEDLLASA